MTDKTTPKIFEEYLSEIEDSNVKLYYNYFGINRKEYPKWAGWKIINEYKDEGIPIKDVNDPKLDTLVRNFYYIRFISEVL